MNKFAYGALVVLSFVIALLGAWGVLEQIGDKNIYEVAPLTSACVAGIAGLAFAAWLRRV